MIEVVVLVTQSVCEPMDQGPPGSSVHGILQARIWSGLPFPPPGDLPDPGIHPSSPALQADSSPPGLLGGPTCIRQIRFIQILKKIPELLSLMFSSPHSTNILNYSYIFILSDISFACSTQSITE